MILVQSSNHLLMPLTVPVKKHFFTRGLRPPDPPPWIPGSIYHPYSRYYMERTLHILPISKTIYGPYGTQRWPYQRVWIVRSIYSSTYQNIWTVRSIFSSTYQKILIVRSIYGSTFEKIVGNSKIQNVIDKSKIVKWPTIHFPCVQYPKSGPNLDMSKIQ